MNISREEVAVETQRILRQLADDWEYGDDITEETFLIRDMGFESLGVVILSAAIQDHYGKNLPFTDLFTEIGQREMRDISVGEWINWTHRHMNNGGM